MASLPARPISFRIIQCIAFSVIWIGSSFVAEFNASSDLGELLKRSGNRKSNFDFFMLSLLWPGTACLSSARCCPSNACCRRSSALTEFTIHGLWPDYNNGTWQACCPGAKFDIQEISPLLSTMNRYWPSFSCESVSNCHGGTGLFWEHEWGKHLENSVLLGSRISFVSVKEAHVSKSGLHVCVELCFTKRRKFCCRKLFSSSSWQLFTHSNFSKSVKSLLSCYKQKKHGPCSSPVIRDEYDYFVTALNLYFKYNVTEVLREAGFVASNTEKYPLGGIISAIENAFYATPEIVCTGDAIEELRLCFHKDFKFRDCGFHIDRSGKIKSEGSCPSYVSLPEYIPMDVRNKEI